MLLRGIKIKQSEAPLKGVLRLKRVITEGQMQGRHGIRIS